MRQTNSRPTPMKPAEFHILLVLAGKDLHGLGIAQAIDEATDGVIRLGPGTLYRTLKQLVATALIEEVSAPDGEEDPRRRHEMLERANLTQSGDLSSMDVSKMDSSDWRRS